MRFLDTLSIIQDIRFVVVTGTIPTLKDVFRTPSLIFHPSEISRIFMAHVWVPFSEGVDEGAREMKETLITPYARGTVLEIGPG
jgi:hypothetical protein